jgi:hypothetical protein
LNRRLGLRPGLRWIRFGLTGCASWGCWRLDRHLGALRLDGLHGPLGRRLLLQGLRLFALLLLHFTRTQVGVAATGQGRVHLGGAGFMRKVGELLLVIGRVVLGLVMLVMQTLDLIVERIALRAHHFAQLDQCSLLLVA